MPANIYDDDLLLKMLAANDQQAINILYQKHHGHLSKTINRIVCDSEVTKDIIQDLFLVLWERRHFLKIRKPIKAYLIRSAIHRSLNFKRDNFKRQIVSFDKYEISNYSKSNCPSDKPIESKELRNMVKSAISSLPAKEKIAFILQRKHHMTYQEIATHLEISQKAVEKRISKAHKFLRDILKPYLKSLLAIFI